jgi:peptidoglycan/xylan/chitin deacetylase (PgdA/CDA1 family)
VSDGPRVALTFDAEHPDRPECPPGTIDRILDELAAARMRATFFLQGRWALAYPDAARRIVGDGHLVGSHSHFHAEMPLLSDVGLAADLAAAADAIVSTIGADPRPWFRCPFGAGADDPRVLAAVERAGYRHVGWHVVVEDWEPDRTGDRVATDVIRGIDAYGDGAVVLLHTWPAATADAVPSILTDLRRRDAIGVAVDELEELP